MGTIQSGSSSALANVGDESKAVWNELRDIAGEVLTPEDWGEFTPADSAVVPVGAVDYKVAHVNRGRSDGSQAVSNDAIQFVDLFEGSALNTNLWTSTLTTWTVATVGSNILTLNPGASLSATTGQLLQSIPRIPRYPRVPILSRTRAKPGAHQANNVHEIGFGNPSSATAAAIADGVVWRKTASGQWQPIVSINGVELTGTAIDDSTFTATVLAGEYAEFEIVIYDDRVEFVIENMAGVAVAGSRQTLDWNKSGAGNPGFATSHLFSMLRSYNSAATAAAVQLTVVAHVVLQLDMPSGKSLPLILAGAGYRAESSPTVFTQTPNYTNGAAPTTRTVANTTAQEPTLGGHVSWNNAGTSFAGADTVDLVLFGYQAPSPFAFVCTGVRIDTINLGAASAAVVYAIEYSLAANASAVSLATAAPNGPRFIPLGFMTLAASAAIGVKFADPIAVPFSTPIVVQPGKFLHLVARVLSGTATLNQVIRTTCMFEGYWQ